MGLFWKVGLINGAVLVAAAALLVLGPFSVSRRPVMSEVVVLGVGLLAMLVVNALLLRSSLGPVDRVVREMATVDPLHPTDRLATPRSAPGRQLVAGFNAMVDRLQDERSASNAKALAAQEAERHRIAQELHDEVGQRLTVVLLGLKRAEQRAPAELAADLALLRETTREGLDDVRRVARQLRPGVLEDLGLASALASLTTDFAQHSGAQVRRVVTPGLPPLPPDTELVLYRVAQEALTNAARHAGATSVELSLTRVGDRVALVVADDGHGFDVRREGAGLRGMRERARLASGELTVTSDPSGTTVRLEVPVTAS
ncbi:sensor histidine kinase [Nocardioides sp. T2.26MG-1]|uniref:sensor histidine kinase n=1 Tax=Nocardioides sp. T2.26MG-1 TaxID=3041166 RepID=UPI0024773213|nr:sensor histidine kinase [Nocardioides sp. T2.26MG-1]CAI9411220.1 hypothetical protein HIDPHFAB_01493 [Nocardioides sp. T2.26MG-1]